MHPSPLPKCGRHYRLSSTASVMTSSLLGVGGHHQTLAWTYSVPSLPDLTARASNPSCKTPMHPPFFFLRGTHAPSLLHRLAMTVTKQPLISAMPLCGGVEREVGRSIKKWEQNWLGWWMVYMDRIKSSSKTIIPVGWGRGWDGRGGVKLLSWLGGGWEGRGGGCGCGVGQDVHYVDS